MVGRPWIAASSCVVVVDAYDPMHLEQLEQGRDAGGPAGGSRPSAAPRPRSTSSCGGRTSCCAPPRSSATSGSVRWPRSGRVNPVTYDADPSLGGLITVVPFGVPDEPSRPRRRSRASSPASAPTTRSSSGAAASTTGSTRSPSCARSTASPARARRAPVLPRDEAPEPRRRPMRMASDLRQLSDELGLTGTHVFFNDGWVPYEERADYLLEADIGVSTHLDHVETAFSFRTRILDYLWAGCRSCHAGDVFASLIEEHGLGLTVDAQDVAGLEAALEALLLDPVLGRRRRGGEPTTGRGAHLGAQPAAAPRVLPAPSPCPDIACPTLEADPRGAGVEVGWRRDLRALHVYLRDGGARVWCGVVPPAGCAAAGLAAAPLAFAHARADPGRAPRVVAAAARRGHEGARPGVDRRGAACPRAAVEPPPSSAPGRWPRARSASPPSRSAAAVTWVLVALRGLAFAALVS